MSSPIAITRRISAEKYVPVHKRSPSSTSSPIMKQTPLSDANNRPPVYSIAELLELSKSPLVQTSLVPEQKQGIVDVMAYIPASQRQTKSRSSSPTESNRSSSPTTEFKRIPSPAKKAKKSPPSETVSLPKTNTPRTPPRRRSSKRRVAETSSNANSDSGHQHHTTRHWGYAPSSHHNEDNWRAHSGVAVAA